MQFLFLASFPLQAQGTLTEGEGSVRLTSLHELVQISCFLTETIFFYRTTYLNDEVNRTDPSPPFQMLAQGALTKEGRISTVDLIVKISHFVKKR